MDSPGHAGRHTRPPYASCVLDRTWVRGTPALRPCKERSLLVTNFSDFQLNPAILKSLGEEGYTQPTPIQMQAIPSVLAGKDLLGIAQTGTGKTAAFALPILHR